MGKIYDLLHQRISRRLDGVAVEKLGELILADAGLINLTLTQDVYDLKEKKRIGRDAVKSAHVRLLLADVDKMQEVNAASRKDATRSAQIDLDRPLLAVLVTEGVHMRLFRLFLLHESPGTLLDAPGLN